MTHPVDGEQAADVQKLHEEDSNSSDNTEQESGYSLDQHSSLLQSLMDVFGDSTVTMGELRSASEGEDSDEEEDDEEVIGFLENPNIAEETGMSTVTELMAAKDKPFTEVISISDEDREIVEGAIRRASSGDFFGQKGSITEAVLSIQNLSKRDSSNKRLVLEKVSGRTTSSTGDNQDVNAIDQLKEQFEPDEHYHQIIPLYHNHAVDVGEDLIDCNLSAISVKPDSHKNLPESHHTGGRNSFRNIFRPDLTYCEGSAKCLRTSLLRQISHSSASSAGSSHANVMSMLDQSHHDVTAHHSDEEIVYTDHAEGVCEWPKSRAFKVHHVIDDIVKEQDEASDEPVGDTNADDNCSKSVNVSTEKMIQNNQEKYDKPDEDTGNKQNELQSSENCDPIQQESGDKKIRDELNKDVQSGADVTDIEKDMNESSSVTSQGQETKECSSGTTSKDAVGKGNTSMVTEAEGLEDVKTVGCLEDPSEEKGQGSIPVSSEDRSQVGDVS